MRALRKCMRHLHKFSSLADGLLEQLSQALVQRYNNGTDKRSRYRPKTPDKKPLGDPTVTKLTAEQCQNLEQYNQKTAA